MIRDTDGLPEVRLCNFELMRVEDPSRTTPDVPARAAP